MIRPFSTPGEKLTVATLRPIQTITGNHTSRCDYTAVLRRLPGLRIYHGVLVLPLSSVTMASSRESTSALHRRPSERNLLNKWLPISGWCREGSSKNVDSDEQLGCLPRPASELNEKNGVGCCLQLRWPISPLASDAYFRGFGQVVPLI